MLQFRVATLQLPMPSLELYQQLTEAELKWVEIAQRVAAAKAAQQQQQQQEEGGQGEHPGLVRAGRQLVASTAAAHAALLPEFAAIDAVMAQMLQTST
jgi:hypothetical protein